MRITCEKNQSACANFHHHNPAIVQGGLALLIAGLVETLNAQTTVLFEGFEGSFPADNGWYVGDNDPQGTPAYWDDVNAAFGGEDTHGGSWKGYCAGVGYDGTSTSPLYRDYMSSEMSRTINLVGYNSATLSFGDKIPSIETGYDYARVYIDSVDHDLVWQATNSVANWTQAIIDLSTYVGTSPTLRFQFYSDSSRTFEGWYLDDILVTGYQPPSNDHCAEAIALPSCAPYSMSTMGATSAGDPVPTCRTNFGKGVWFTYTPASDGPVKISTCGSSFDTVVQV